MLEVKHMINTLVSIEIWSVLESSWCKY